jgi:hypothetical protein
MTLKLDLDPFYDALHGAFGLAIGEYAAICEEEIEAEQWRWPRETIRSGGFVVGEPRDIVDTGKLRDSVTIAQNPTDRFEGAVGYTVDYAPDVHEGQVKRGALLPARPWMETAAQRFDLAKFIADEMPR